VRWWVLATTPRTGSTLLSRALWATEQIGAPKEYLNPTQLRDWEIRFAPPLSRMRHAALRGPAVGLAGLRPWSEARVREHLQRIATHRSGPHGHVGLKVHHHHWARHLPGDRAHRLLPHPRWIRLRREDRLDQAISWVRARQSGRWAAHRRSLGLGLERYSRRAITRALRDIDRGERGWDAIIGREPCLELTYQALVDHPLLTVNRVLDWLDAPPVSTVSLELRPQADARTERWRTRYLAGR